MKLIKVTSFLVKTIQLSWFPRQLNFYGMKKIKETVSRLLDRNMKKVMMITWVKPISTWRISHAVDVLYSIGNKKILKVLYIYNIARWWLVQIMLLFPYSTNCNIYQFQNQSTIWSQPIRDQGDAPHGSRVPKSRTCASSVCPRFLSETFSERQLVL